MISKNINENSITGIIFNVQRFSIYDGPGIRTMVFFKGCNLRCLWCHNPESQNAEPERFFYAEKCVHCGKCLSVCSKAFLACCDSCGRCVAVCTHNAREITGRVVSTEKLYEDIIKDKAFYDLSGGGVTFSGGEPLLQPEFLLQMLQKCKESGIHTAVETAGNVKNEIMQSVLQFTDLVLFDLKAINPVPHKKCTGTSNRLILENARWLKENCQEKILFRMPVVPGYNDSEVETVARFAEPVKLELLPYHRTGAGKYAALGRLYAVESVQPPSTEMMRSLAERFDNVFCEENIV